MARHRACRHQSIAHIRRNEGIERIAPLRPGAPMAGKVNPRVPAPGHGNEITANRFMGGFDFLYALCSLHIQYGARRFVDRLREQDIPHHYEEFEGTHSAIDWRLDHSLPYLVSVLKNASSEQINA